MASLEGGLSPQVLGVDSLDTSRSFAPFTLFLGRMPACVINWDVSPLYEQFFKRDDYRGYYNPYSGLLVSGGTAVIYQATIQLRRLDVRIGVQVQKTP